MPEFCHPDDKRLSFVMRRKPSEDTEVHEVEYMELDAESLGIEELGRKLIEASGASWVYSQLDEYNDRIILRRNRSEEEIQKDREKFHARLAKWEEDYNSNTQTLNELFLLKRKQEELQDKLKV